MQRLFIAFLLCAAAAQSQNCADIPPGINTPLNGFVPFPTSAGWHRDISTVLADTRSDAWINNLRATIDRRFRKVYPPSVTDGWQTPREGLSYSVVAGTQARVPVAYTSPEAYPNDSDPGPFPIPADAVVQGTIGPGSTVNMAVAGDKHLMVIDRDSCLLYELWNVTGTGKSITAGTGAVYDLLGGDHQRPYFMTGGGSVSGMPLFAGMIRYDEIAAGEINHAIAVTGVQFNGSQSFTGMASHHQYLGPFDPTTLPLGGRIRLRADYDISGFTPETQVVMRALKKYGMILTDGGLAVDMFASTDARWTFDSTVEMIQKVFLTSNGDWTAVTAGDVYCDASKTCGLQPSIGLSPMISLYTSSASTGPGSPVTLSWRVGGVPSRIRFITPDVGPVVTDSVTVNPQKTTAYTLMVQNENGRTSQTVTVNVPAGASATATGVSAAPPPAPMQISAYFRQKGSTADLKKYPSTGGYQYRWLTIEPPLKFWVDTDGAPHIGLTMPTAPPNCTWDSQGNVTCSTPTGPPQ